MCVHKIMIQDNNNITSMTYRVMTFNKIIPLYLLKQIFFGFQVIIEKEGT